MTFEEKMKRLQEIVAQLETGESDLDESLKLYEEGLNLLKSCNDQLNDFSNKATTILSQYEKGELDNERTTE